MPRRVRYTRWVLREPVPVAAVALPLVSVGIFAFLTFFAAACVMRTKALWATAAVYLAAFVALLVIAVNDPGDAAWVNVATTLLTVGVAVVGFVHALVLRRTLPKRPERYVAEPVGPDPAAAADVGSVRALLDRLDLTAYAPVGTGISMAKDDPFEDIRRNSVAVVSFAERGGRADAALGLIDGILRVYFTDAMRDPRRRDARLAVLATASAAAAQSMYRDDAAAMAVQREAIERELYDR